MRKHSMSRFWKIYLIAAVSLFVIISVGLAVFYDFIRAYEYSQPIHVAESYTASLDENILGAWIDQAAEQLTLTYESAQNAAQACRAALSALEGEYSCMREYASSSDAPVYIVSRGNTPVGKFSLREIGGGRYGFTEWEAVPGEALLAYLQADSVSLVVCAPRDSVIRVNDILIGEKAENVQYPFVSEYEKSTAVTADMFQISGLYGQPKLTCTLNGTECEEKQENGIHWFLYPNSYLQTYSVYAPEDAVVTVNGAALKSDKIAEKGIAYPYSPVEVSASSLPHEVRYEISGLLSLPSVQVMYSGEKLAVTEKEGVFRAVYPESKMFGYLLKVPTGSRVTMRGVSCDSYRTTESVEAYPGLYSDPARAPMYDIYRFSGLYLPADDIKVKYEGNSYSVSDGDITDGTVHYPKTENGDVENLALTFAKDYFTYISGGYSNTDANLAKALSHVQKGSALYSSIQRSLIGISYVTPVTSMQYNRLEITDMHLLPGGDVYCRISFDIDQKIYNVSRSYTGSLTLAAHKSGNNWTICEMLTESNN